MKMPIEPSTQYSKEQSLAAEQLKPSSFSSFLGVMIILFYFYFSLHENIYASFDTQPRRSLVFIFFCFIVTYTASTQLHVLFLKLHTASTQLSGDIPSCMYPFIYPTYHSYSTFILLCLQSFVIVWL